MRQEKKKTELGQGPSLVPSKDVFWNFLAGVKEEFRKISWTNREELKVYTKVVILTTFVFGMLVFCTDFFIQNCLDGLDYVIKKFVS